MKLYCLVLQFGDYEDMEMTLSFDKAKDWLSSHKKSGQILEYTVTDDGISKEWDCMWEYVGDELNKSAK